MQEDEEEEEEDDDEVWCRGWVVWISSVVLWTPSAHVWFPSVSHVREQLSRTSRNSGSFYNHKTQMSNTSIKTINKEKEMCNYYSSPVIILSPNYWPRCMWGHVQVLPLPCQSPEYPAGPHTTPPTLHHTTALLQGGTAGAGVATRQSSRQSVSTHRHSATRFTLDLEGRVRRPDPGGLENKDGAQSSCTIDNWHVRKKSATFINQNCSEAGLITNAAQQSIFIQWQTKLDKYTVYCVIHLNLWNDNNDSKEKTVTHTILIP